MPKIAYIDKKFNSKTLEVVEIANGIMEEYAEEGFSLTLRQLYYQFVARGLMENQQASYNRLGYIINQARLSGLVDWDHIIDRTRNLQKNGHWNTPGEIIQAVSEQYRVDLWKGQTYRPEVWIEKDALIGVIEGVCMELDVPHFACRGYTSQSEQWAAAQRLLKWREGGQVPVIFHLGDHDPSGIDMTRDISARFEMFTGQGIAVHRIALNMDQINQFKPPPNPAKQTDKRFKEYASKYGSKSWELDALDPTVISGMVEKEIKGLIDPEPWGNALLKQETEREQLTTLAQRWGDISDTFNGKSP